MFVVPKAQVGLIGSDAMARTLFACKLRQHGISTHSELTDRKRARMLTKAREEATIVVDLDTADDLQTLFVNIVETFG